MTIINNNVQNVKFLRNGTLYGTHDVAYAALTGFGLTTEQDGTIILARYGSGSEIKTLAGIVYAVGDVKTITIIDVEGASGDVDEKIKAAIEALDAEITSSDGTNVQVKVTEADGKITAVNVTTDNTVNSGDVDTAITTAINNLDYTGVTTGDGVYVTNVTETDGKISATTATLPDASSVADDNKVITDVTQSKGAITATPKLLTGVKLSGYAEADSVADIATSDTLGQALGKLQKTIHEMDLEVVSGNGEVITAVSEANGVVDAKKAAIKDVKLTGYVKDTTKTGNIAATDDIEDALSKLENKAAAITINDADHSINVTPTTSGTDISVNIKSGEKVLAKDANGVYTDLDLVKITTGLPAEVKERYQLLATDDSQIGVNIDIPKDSHIVSINYITDSGDTHYQNLEYVYIDASGDNKTTYVDMSSLVLEAEFASGVTVTNNVAHGVVDANSEKDESNVAFLTVGADGFKVSGIKDAIDTKINKLDASVTGGTTAGTATSNHIQVVVDEADGKLTAVTVTETNIADKTKLEELSAKTVTEIASSNASISATSSTTADGTVKYDVVTDASKIQMSGFTAAESGFTAIAQSSSVTQAFKAVETYVLANEKTVATALNDLNDKISAETANRESADTQINNSLTAINNSLTAEIAARKAVDGQNGDTYAANSGKAYISGATSLNDADIKLNDALAALDGDVIKQVKVNNVTLAESSNAVNVQISSTPATGTSASPIVVNTDASTGAVTLQISQIDCGTY